MRFLYGVTLGRETLDLMASVPHMKRATRRAEVYARSEVEAILTAPRQPRDRVLLMTVYGCGLRISEATQLKTSDIDRACIRCEYATAREPRDALGGGKDPGKIHTDRRIDVDCWQ